MRFFQCQHSDTDTGYVFFKCYNKCKHVKNISLLYESSGQGTGKKTVQSSLLKTFTFSRKTCLWVSLGWLFRVGMQL